MKIMSLQNIGFGLIGGVMALTVMNCTDNRSIVKEAEEKATVYLTGEEYIDASERASHIPVSGCHYNASMKYWDSIAIEGRAERAYQEGMKMVNDSAAGLEYKRPEYSFEERFAADKPYTDSDYRVIKNELIKEIAKDHTGPEIAEMIEKAPNDMMFADSNSQFGFLHLHYWNNLYSFGRERSAFEQGANDARKELNDSN